ncbi:MAG: hypothetical protein K2Z81_20140, partial [Cyanobacteria bacterium]|nr:hypothetical protein [Cyanobacteriota bacterium]
MITTAQQSISGSYLLDKLAEVVAQVEDKLVSSVDGGLKPTSLTESEEKLGQLMVSTGLVSEDVLQECLSIATQNSTPIGLVLSLEGGIKAEDVARAVCIQGLVQRGLSLTMGRIVLRYSVVADVTVEEALKAFSLDSDSDGLDGWLLEMLDSCNLLSKYEQDQSQSAAREQNTSWARYLAENALISVEILSAAMHGLVLMDLGSVSYEDAVLLVRAAATKGSALPMILRLHSSQHCFNSQTVNLPAMFYASATISERQALDLISVTYKSKVDPLELVASRGLVSEKQVELALDLQFNINLQLVAQSTVIAKLRAANPRVSRAVPATSLKRNFCESLKCVDV